MGEVWTYYYDDRNRLTGVDGAEHYRIRYHYDGNYLSSIVQDKQVWRFRYNDEGDCIETTEPTGLISKRVYDTRHNVLLETQYLPFNGSNHPGPPHTTRYIYDERGHLLFSIKADGTVTECRYDEQGLLISTRCYLLAAYDSKDLADDVLLNKEQVQAWVLTQNPKDVSLTEYRYDWRGQRTDELHYKQVTETGVGLSIDALHTRYRYDAAGRLIEKSTPLNGDWSITQFIYDDLGRLIQTIDNQNNSQKIEYDDLHQRIIQTDANGLQTIRIYDHSGLLLSVMRLDSSHDYGITSYQYDSAGRLVAETGVDGLTRYNFYDMQGRLIAKVEGNGQATEYRYASNGLLLSTHEYQNKMSTANWQKPLPSFSEIKPQSGMQDRISQLVYNQFNQLAYRIDAQGAVIGYEYNEYGQVASSTAFANRITNYNLNQLLAVNEIRLSADALHDRHTVYYYDNEGLLKAEVNGEGFAKEYKYDRLGNLIELCRYFNAVIVHTGIWTNDCPQRSNKDIYNFVLYDARNLKIAEIDGEGYLIEYRYNEAGLLIEQCAYERAIGRPIKINEATDLNQIRPKGQTNDHHSYYSYNSLGLLIQEKKYNSLVTNYSYDEMGHLSSKSLIDAKTHTVRQQQHRYDALGRIIQSLDELGCALLNQSSIDADAIELIWQKHSVSFSYNQAGLLVSKTNSLEQNTRYFYDEQARLRYTINPDGAVIANNYNSFNQIASIKKYSSFVKTVNKDTTTNEITKKLDLIKDERFDEVIRYEYNTLGQLIAQYQGSKGLISTQYNAFGELEQTNQRVNAQQSKMTEYHYDRRGLLTRSINDPASIKQIATSEYDAFGYLNASLDQKMNKTRYTLNKRGEQVQILRSDNLFKRVSYDAFGRVIIETDFNAKDIKQYIFDDQNQKLTLINPQTNSQIVTEFSAFGDTISIENANGYKTEHFYNEQGQLIRVNSPEGAFKEYHYDELGRLCFELDAGGYKISYTYDASGHVLTKTTDPDGLKLTTAYQYDASGRQLQVKDANGCIKQFIYDDQGRLIQSCTDPQGLNIVTHFDYDDRGLLVKQTELNAQGYNKTISYEWDNLGRKSAVLIDPEGLNLRTSYQYDANNNLSAQTDANGQTTHYIFDINNRCNYQINALGQVTEHVYDKNSNEIQTTRYAKPINLLSQYDEQSIKALLSADKGDQYQFRTFNGDNALTQLYDGLGYLTLYDYDAASNVIKKTQYNQAVSIESLKLGARERPLDKSARVEHYVYDGLNRLRFQCDQFGRITESAYDKSGQLIAKTRYSQFIELPSNDASFTLEVIRVKINRTPGKDQCTRYAYDAAHNLIMEVSAQGVVRSYAHDALGHVISNTVYATAITSTDTPLKLPASTANDRTNHYVYDAAGREVYRISAEGRVLERNYDAVGNVIQELTYASLIHPSSYTQKAVHHALANLNGSRTTGYEYDAAGRLLAQRNAQQHATHYSYDGQGNVTSKTEANHAVWTYKYDAFNQLIETISPSVTIAGVNNRAIITRNVYDCFGNLTALIRDAEGIKQTVCYEYDAVNQKIKTLYPNSKVSNASNRASDQRQENAITLTEELRYNAFGQVIASSDKAHNWKHFAFNQRGLLIYSIDAQSAVTHYEYDVFDRLTTKTIHASVINLSQDSQLSEKVIKKALNRNSNDRHEYYEYTLDNHIAAISKDPVSMYNSKTRHYELLRPITRNLYNNFGELIKSSVKVNENEWVTTHHYYNQDGKQIALIDAAGYLTAYLLNAYGEIETTTEFSTALSEWDTEHYKPPIASQKDRISVLTYDALGQITSKTLKQVSFQRKSSDGQYFSMSQDLVTRYQYDALGHLVATTDVKGNTAYCYYNELGQLIAKVAPQTQAGRAATTYSYDVLGNLLETRQWANGATQADATHFVLNSASDTYDIVKKQEYDTHGLLIAQSDGVNHKTYYSYDANGNLARSWSEFSQIGTISKIIQDKRYSYDKANRLLQTATFKSNGRCKTEDVTYNAFGEVTAKGIDGHFATHVDYDVLGRAWRSNTNGHYEIYVYDLMDRVTQIVTATNGFSTLYGEGVDLSSDLFESTSHYDKDNLLLDVQRQNNIYNALGHLISQNKEFTKGAEVSQGEHLEYINQSQEVDRWGNMLRFTNPHGYQTYYEYNAFNEVVRQELPEIKVVDEHGVARYIRPVNRYAYNELGQAIAMIDANGHTVSKEYDALGHLIKETDAKNNSRQKQYNLLEQLSRSTNELGGVTTYSYDRENRLTAVSTPGTQQHYEYDEAGQLVKQVKGKNESTMFWYDSLGNQIKRTDARGYSSHFQYDDSGHKIHELDAKGNSQSWLYSDDKLIEHTDLGGRKTSYRYNSNGLLLEEQSTAGKHIKYHYEGNGGLVDYYDEYLDERAKFSYDLEGRIIKKESGQGGDGSDGWLREIDLYQYDALGRLTEVRRRNPDDTDSRFPDKDHALLSIDYEYDAVGNIRHTQVHANYTGYDIVNNDEYYTYDQNNRMTINKGSLVNGAIQITTSQGSRMSYDAAGNIQTAEKYEKGVHEQFAYIYDQDNQLIVVQKDGRAIQAKEYDNAGRVFHETTFDTNEHVSQSIVMTYEQGVLVAQDVKDTYNKELSRTIYGYDEVGNMTALDMKIKSKYNKYSDIEIKHQYSYELWDNYQQSADHASQKIGTSPITYGHSVKEYNSNGQLSRAVDQLPNGDGTSNSARYWNSSLEGIKAREDKEGKTNYLAINGKTIGDLRLDKNKKQHLTVYGGFTPSGSAQTTAPGRSFAWKKANNFTTTSTFLERKRGEQASDAVLPESSQNSAGCYTLQAGDTLESVALQVYGDSSLWYLIADANGITDRTAQASNNGALRIGQRINTPPVATGQHNTSGSRKVMNANDVIGNTSASTPLPASPPPLPKKHHGLFAKIVLGIVAVVATVLTAGVIGYLSGALAGTSGSLFALGGAVLGGTSSLGVASSLGAGFAAGFIGNLATQGVSKAFGMQDNINFKGALINGLATAASSGLLKGVNSSSAFNGIVQKMEGYAINQQFNISHSAQMMFQNASSQGINIALNKHQHFDWEQLGSNGIFSGLMGSRTGQNVQSTLKGLDKTGTVSSHLASLASAGLNALTKGTEFNAIEVLKENLGSTIGGALVDLGKKAILEPLYDEIDGLTLTHLDKELTEGDEHKAISYIPEYYFDNNLSWNSKAQGINDYVKKSLMTKFKSLEFNFSIDPQYKSNFYEIHPKVAGHEGGYSNHKNDRGGATNRGITIGTFKAYAKSDLGVEPTLKNLKKLTHEQAMIIYKKRFWDPLKCDEIKSKSLAYALYDFHVNATGSAIKNMQESLNLQGHHLKVDNKMGALTIEAINTSNSEKLFKDYQNARINHYNDRVKKHPDQSVFLKGWLSRTNSTKFED